MDIIKLDRWIAPTENGAPLLCMPNIPKPLHGLAPRTIEGQAKWNIMRTKCYMDADYTCQACGKYLGAGKCEAHELYSVDWEHQTSKFERCVCLCKDCHSFIHSGRTFSMYQRKTPFYDKFFLQKIAKKAFALVSKYNNGVSEDEKLKLYGTIIEWLKNDELSQWLEPMVNYYNVKMYGAKKAYEDKKHWGKWRLIYNGKKYEPKYKDAKEWIEAMNE